jgi:hypothetical protein
MHFAFPYGQTHNMTEQAIQYVHDQGFRSYVSAYGGYNFPTAGGFHLKRFHGDPNFARMQNWLSFDPRWMHAKPEAEFEPQESQPREPELAGCS